MEPCVNAGSYDGDGGWGWAQTRPDGTYVLEGLATGDYRVEADASDQGFTRQFFSSTDDWGLAERVTATAGLTTSNIDFVLTSGGAISGFVTNEAGGAPVANADVWAERYDCCGGGNGARTALDGSYEITGLAQGDYRVQVRTEHGGFVGEFYDDTTDWAQATRVPVGSGTTTQAIDFSLGSGGAISGTVTDEVTGLPLADVNVWAEIYDCCGAGNWAQTGADGTYRIEGLPSGDYRVTVDTFDQGYVREFFASTTDWNEASKVTVTAGAETANVDFSLVTGGTIAGRVTRESDGTPVADADVWADTYDCCGGGNGARTNANGEYVIEGLTQGSYRVQVRADEHGLVGEFYPSTTDWALATPVDVVPGTPTENIDFSLLGGGSITGHVYEADGTTALVGANVFANSETAGWGHARTDGNGFYEISGLASGSYHVEADASDRGFVREFYDDTTDYGSASPVPVTAGTSTPNIDFVMTSGGSISGVVYDTDGVTPLGDVDISANSEVGGGGHTRSRGDGSYKIEGLATGVYRVSANLEGYIHLFYSSTPSYDEATLVDVTTGAETQGIDIVMQTGGSISGTVVTANPGDPIAGVDVWANSYDGAGGGNGTRTNLDGTYEITGLAPDQYRVRAQKSDAGYVGEWYDDTTDWGAATPVVVAAGAPTTGIDFDLGSGGAISGFVFNASGTDPIAGADVWAESFVCCGGGNGARTASDGSYRIDGLSPGDYRVQASNPGFAFEYYDNTDSYDSSTPVTVTSDGDRSGVNFTLDQAGTISGTVYNASGTAPIENANVWANRQDGGGGSGAQTAADGTYTVDSLTGGSYIVSAMKDGYITEFYQEVSDYESSTEVVVVGGQDRPNVDFTLETGGSISGTVVNASGTPVVGANVGAHPAGGGCCGGGAPTRLDGTYTITGLATGSYLVIADRDGFVQTFFDGVANHASATPVAVVAGAESQNVDFVLLSGGAISGVVRNASGTAPLPNVEVRAQPFGGGPGEDVLTGADGSYRIDDLGPGQYRVVAGGQNYIEEFWQETPEYASATPVTVVQGGDEQGIDFTLESGGSISGMVYNAAGTVPTGDADVWVEEVDGPEEGPGGPPPLGTRSLPDGSYTISGLLPGQYIVQARADNHALEYYLEAFNFASATPVSVTAGADRGNTDFTLEPAGTISGTVTQEVGGAPIGDVRVFASPAALGWPPEDIELGARTEGDGSYTIEGVPAGDYLVTALAGDQDYVIEFYDDTTFPASSTDVTVTAGADRGGVDFDLIQGGSISGTIFEDDGTTPIEGIEVFALRTPDGTPIGFTGSGPDGSYTLGGLPAGNYLLLASDEEDLGFRDELYDDVADLEDFGSATPVPVTGTDNTPDIDFTLVAVP